MRNKEDREEDRRGLEVRLGYDLAGTKETMCDKEKRGKNIGRGKDENEKH